MQYAQPQQMAATSMPAQQMVPTGMAAKVPAPEFAAADNAAGPDQAVIAAADQ